MPLPPMTKKEQAAYDEALERIEARRRDGGTGLTLLPLPARKNPLPTPTTRTDKTTIL